MSLKSRIYSLRVRLSDWIAPKIDSGSTFIVPEPKHRLGKVVKVISPAEYDVNKPTIKGGKVVRLMPKQLKKIKEAQDKINEM